MTVSETQTDQQDIAGGGGSADPEDKATEAPTPETKDRSPEEPPSATAAGVPHVEDAAPEDVDENPESSLVLPSDSDYDLSLPATMAEQKAPKLQGEAEKRGYYGETAADRAKAEKAELDAALQVQDNAEAVAAVNTDNEEN